MIIDIVCLIFILIYAAFGYFTGAMQQLVKLVSLVLAYLAALWIQPIVVDFLMDFTGDHHYILESAAMLASWLVLYLAFSFTGKLIVKTLKAASEKLTGIDRGFGFLLGAIKAMLIIILLLYFVSTIQERIFDQRPEAIEIFKESKVMSFLLETREIRNILSDNTKGLLDLAESMSSKEKRIELSKDADMKNIIEQPLMQEIFSDPELIKDIAEPNYLKLLKDPRIHKLLQDKELRDMFMNLVAKQAEKSDK